MLALAIRLSNLITNIIFASFIKKFQSLLKIGNRKKTFLRASKVNNHIQAEHLLCLKISEVIL